MFERERGRGRGARPGVLAGVFGLWLGLAATLSAATTPAPRWVAADAAIYLELPRPAPLIERAMGPQVQAALRVVPQLERYFQGEQYGTLRRVADLVADRLGTTAEDALRGLTAGGMTFAIEGEAGVPPRSFLIVTPDDPELARKASDALLALARQDAANQGKDDPVKSAEYRGIAGYAVGKAAYALVDGSLVISDKSETLKTVIDRARDGVKGGGGAIADDAAWKARRARVEPETLAWGLVRLDRLRELDPRRFKVPEKLSPPQTFLFGSWLDALRTADRIEARLTWSDRRLGADVTLPVPSGGSREVLKGFIPAAGSGAPALVSPPGMIAGASLWRDLAAIWEARSELFTPEVQQDLAKLDTFAGQFFGGRDFGSGVLGALDPRWRLVVAHQDYESLSPAPDVKLPGFALIADLNPDDEDFNQRLKVAFQSFVGLANLGAAQKSAPPLELGSEVCEGVTISTSHYMVPRADAEEKGPVHQRFNFTPSIAQVDNHFILSSSLGLTRALIRTLKTPAASSDVTLLAEADGPALARLVTLNRDRLILQNMLDKGHGQAEAETEIGRLERLLKFLGRGRLTVRDGPETLRFDLGFTLFDSDPNP